jgi:hypothetical protein
MLKRQMFGRADFDLVRERVPSPRETVHDRGFGDPPWPWH